MKQAFLAAAVIAFGVSGLQAAPIAVGTKVGVDLGPTPTLNWNNFTADGTIGAGSVVGLDGAVVDNVSIATSNSQFYNNDGTNNWAGLSTNGGVAPPEFVDSVTTDIAGNFDKGDAVPYTITLSGLNASLQYRVVAVSAAPASGQIDTLTITGASVYTPSALDRSVSNTGAFHTFASVQPDANGVLTIGVTDTSNGTNPIIGGVLLTAVPEPASVGLLGLGATAMLTARRRRAK